MLADSRLPGSRDHRITTDTCWLLGAGASLDAIGPNQEIGVRRCVPLTVDLMRDIQPNLVDRLQSLHRRANVPLPVNDIHEALTYKLGPCIDWLKALCNERNPTIANDAL